MNYPVEIERQCAAIRNICSVASYLLTARDLIEQDKSAFNPAWSTALEIDLGGALYSLNQIINAHNRHYQHAHGYMGLSRNKIADLSESHNPER